MAASRSMCGIFRVVNLTRHASKKTVLSQSRQLFSCINHQNVLRNNCRLFGSFYCSKRGLYTNVTIPSLQKHFYSEYSTQTTPSGSTAANLADDILKGKISPVKEKDEREQKPPDDENKGRFANWTGKNAWKLGLLFLTGGAMLNISLLISQWGAPKLNDEGEALADEFSELPTVLAYFKRSMQEFNFFKQMIRDPSSEKLLPDPLTEPYYQPPYTLVLEMTGVLVHPDWTLSTGWRFKKRPGIDFFLQQIGPPLFEVVIYTAEQGFTAFPIIDGLDPQGYIMYRLFRDATRYQDGHHVKDLSCLNRDLSKVIIVDCNAKSVQLQPRNAVALPKWMGNDDDRTLIDLAQFLRTIAISGVDDIRTVLDHYNQYDDPLQTFKENQRLLHEQQERAMREAVEKKDQKSLAGGIGGFFGRRR